VEAPFSLGDPDELRRLLERAGFRRVTLADETNESRFADPTASSTAWSTRMRRWSHASLPTPGGFADYLDRSVHETREVVASHRRGDHVVTPMCTRPSPLPSRETVATRRRRSGKNGEPQTAHQPRNRCHGDASL
jgi:hypothetical protein